MRRRTALTLAFVMAATLVAPSFASGVTTIGSPLTLSPSPSSTCGTATFANTALASSLQAPFDGGVIRWRLSIPDPGGSFLYQLRVLRPVPGTGTYRGVGTGPPQMAPSAGINTLELPTPLRVKAGDLVGVDCPNGAPSPSRTVGGAPTTSTLAFWSPSLQDGTDAAPTNQVVGEEILVNADIGFSPSNLFSLGKVKLNRRRGTAKLTATVPGPGSLATSGKGVKARTAGERPAATPSVTSAGNVKLAVIPKGKVKGKLNSTGRATIRVNFTYTPSGGEVPALPNMLSKKVKLVKRG